MSNPNRLELRRSHLAALLTHLATLENSSRPELAQLRQTRSVPEDEFSVAEELELLTTNIRGYATQIRDQGCATDLQMAYKQLTQMNVFAVEAIAKFYFDADTDYPSTRDYIRMLDYLRLSVLEYLQAQENAQPIPA